MSSLLQKKGGPISEEVEDPVAACVIGSLTFIPGYAEKIQDRSLICLDEVGESVPVLFNESVASLFSSVVSNDKT